MKDELTEAQMKTVRRIAGGKQSSPKKIRDAAHRVILGYADEEDYEMIQQYIE